MTAKISMIRARLERYKTVERVFEELLKTQNANEKSTKQYLFSTKEVAWCFLLVN